MIRSWGHPKFAELSRYAHDELDSGPRLRVAAHLAGCERCWQSVQFILELRVAARSLSWPDPAGARGEQALARILERRAAGERVIIPLSGPIPLDAFQRRRFRAVAAVVVPLVVIAALVVGVPRLRADRSQLEFSPARPASGARIHASYTAGSLFASTDRLVLRARFRAAMGHVRTLTVAPLERGPNGEFHGDFVLPDSVVYATFAVEDTAGTRVDFDPHRPWELLAYDEHGAPRFESLRGRVEDGFGENWEVAHDAARQMVELYPARAGGWALLYAVESNLVGSRAVDSLKATHQDRLKRLAAAAELEADTLPAAERAGLVYYAIELGDKALTRRWAAHLEAVAPHDRMVALNRWQSVRPATKDDPARWLAVLEEMWRDFEDAHRMLASDGYRTALQLGDSAAAVRWADRVALAQPQAAGNVAADLTEHDELRGAGIERLRRELARMRVEPDARRPLHRSRTDERRRLRKEATRLLAILGDALVASGRVAQGIDSVRVAAGRGWDPVVYRRASKVFLAVGDTTAALPFLAGVAVDPVIEPAARDSLTTIGLTWASASDWSDWTTRAELAMRNYFLAESIHRPVSSEIALDDLAGHLHTLDSLVGGSVALVAIWSHYPTPVDRELPKIQKLTDRITALGGRVLVITDDEPSAELRALLAEQHLSLPIVSDSRGDAVLAFRPPGVPDYFVVDAGGFVRFEHSMLEDAVRQIAILRSTGPPVAAPVVSAPATYAVPAASTTS